MLLLFVLSLLLATTPLWAAEDATPRFQKALGFQAGQLSGLGLSYQEWKGDKGYQVAAGAMYYPASDYAYRILDYTIGVELQSSLYHDSFSNWLAGRLTCSPVSITRYTICRHRSRPRESSAVLARFQQSSAWGGIEGGDLVRPFLHRVGVGYGVFWTATNPQLITIHYRHRSAVCTPL